MQLPQLTIALLFLGMSLLRPAPANGQWAVGLEIGSDRYWGSSVELAEQHRSFRPYRPTSFGVGLEKRGHPLGAALHLRFAGVSLALEGSDAVVAIKGVFNLYHASPELVYRIATLGGTNELRVHAGPVFDLWTIEGEDAQVRMVSLRLPLGGRFSGVLLAHLALTSSPLSQEQIIDGYERRALWRRSVGAALQFRL
jgi:hypothetical protein